MKQIHFQSRLHIISWLAETCPRKAIVRALNEGQVEFFGGFNPVPPTIHPGWIMRMTSVYDKTWYVAVICYGNRYGIRILRDVPWSNWCGTNAKGGYMPHLFCGDSPHKYEELRRIWNENR